nr:MAG TPA: hypothetical protein [Caudoviricetes sp.]
MGVCHWSPTEPKNDNLVEHRRKHPLATTMP